MKRQRRLSDVDISRRRESQTTYLHQVRGEIRVRRGSLRAELLEAVGLGPVVARQGASSPVAPHLPPLLEVTVLTI